MVTSSAVVGSSAISNLRVTCQGDGDHHPLAHSAGKLVGVVFQAARRIGNANKLQQALAARRVPRLAHAHMFLQRFHDLETDREHRIKMVIGS